MTDQTPTADEWESAGDIFESANGLEITTPTGRWALTDEESLSLIQGLAAMLAYRLTRPASAEDRSSILARGRELRRPAYITSELAAIGDTHA